MASIENYKAAAIKRSIRSRHKEDLIATTTMNATTTNENHTKKHIDDDVPGSGRNRTVWEASKRRVNYSTSDNNKSIAYYANIVATESIDSYYQVGRKKIKYQIRRRWIVPNIVMIMNLSRLPIAY